MRPTLHAVLLAAALVTSVAAAPDVVTVDQIIALSKAGVSDDVILATIERDKPVFTLEPDRLIALKREGVSEAVVLAMLKSGRQPPSQAAVLPLVVGPDVVIVGHAPDRPNVGQVYWTEVVAGFPLAFPVRGRANCVAKGSSQTKSSSETGSFGRFMSDPTARFQNNGFLAPTEADDGPQFVTCSSGPRARPRRF